MRIKIKIGACWISGKYLGKHFRRRQYTEQILLCNLLVRYSCFWIIPAILLFSIFYSFPTSVKIFLSSRIVDYLNVPGFSSDIEFLNEWVIYMNAVYPLENFEIDKFWEGKKNELPLMWKASRSLWTPASAADVERSFSILTLLDSPKRDCIHILWHNIFLCEVEIHQNQFHTLILLTSQQLYMPNELVNKNLYLLKSFQPCLIPLKLTLHFLFFLYHDAE